MKAHLCSFADDFPDRVAAFLEREKSLSRNFREETITDLWAGAMLALGRSSVTVDFPDERKTGADLELWFVSRKLDRSLSFVIQAKRAWCNHSKSSRRGSRRQCAIKRLDRHGFRHLDHAGGVGKPKGSQARALVNQFDSDRHPIYPLYAFYIPEHACAAGADVRGVVLADGYGVWRDVAAGLTPGSKTARTYKQIKTLQEHFLPFDALFCGDGTAKSRPAEVMDHIARTGGMDSFLLFLLSGGTVEYAYIPDPSDVAARVTRSIERCREESGVKAYPMPMVRNGVPREIAARFDGETATGSYRPDEAKDSGAPRWRMIFRASFDPQH